MKLLHQLGFRYKWNIESYKNGSGDGFIFSPINIPSSELEKIDLEMREQGFFDPQIYFPKDSKSKLGTYDYFPNNMIPNFQTTDFEASNLDLAQKCIDFQVKCDFGYFVIPTRYFEAISTDYFRRLTINFVEPHLQIIKKIGIKDKKILLTCIVKQETLTDDEKRDYFLNWVTGIDGIDGVYIIFENNFSSKQIKEIGYIHNALIFIDVLKQNDLEVHIGYCNTEGLLYSIANPDSITMGSYENLRTFKPSRFQTSTGTGMRSPNARIYSGQLLQWIDYNYLAAMRALIPSYEDYFEESIYKPLLFEPSFKWHFQKSEPYKHFLEVYGNQINNLPEIPMDRIAHIRKIVTLAIEGYEQISESGVLLDSNSDGSHLTSWYSVLSMYEKYKNDL